MSNMWSGDMQSGIAFTFKMFMIGVSLAIGVFLSLIPKKAWVKKAKKRYLSSRIGRGTGAIGAGGEQRYFPIGEVREGKIGMMQGRRSPTAGGGGGASLTGTSAGIGGMGARYHVLFPSSSGSGVGSGVGGTGSGGMTVGDKLV
jgi:hypothetical protein